MKITNVELKTATSGNDYKQITVDERINDKDRFNVFNNHTMYADLVVGYELDAGQVTFDGKYLNLTDPDAGIKGKGGGSRSGMIKQAMNEKNEMIHRAQENKEEGIKLSSSIRMAVDVVNTYPEVMFEGKPTEEQLQRKIEQWRSYFYTNWDKVTQDTPPF